MDEEFSMHDHSAGVVDECDQLGLNFLVLRNLVWKYYNIEINSLLGVRGQSSEFRLWELSAKC